MGELDPFLLSHLSYLTSNTCKCCLQMNILVANSRGAGLRELIPKNIIDRVDFRPGAKLKQISQITAHSIKGHRLCDKTHVYVMAGIPDITNKTKSDNYEEVIFIESKEQANAQEL